MSGKITILDYGTGNYRSVSNFFSQFDKDLQISRSPNVISQADVLVLPGVGNFAAVMECLNEHQLRSTIEKYAESRKLILGICIGMHILGATSEEAPGVEGLGLMDFHTIKRNSGCHIGWQKVAWNTANEDVPESEIKFYFNHAYLLAEADDIVAHTATQERIPSVIRKAGIIGLQFHPEKSQQNGKDFVGHILAQELRQC